MNTKIRETALVAVFLIALAYLASMAGIEGGLGWAVFIALFGALIISSPWLGGMIRFALDLVEETKHDSSLGSNLFEDFAGLGEITGDIKREYIPQLTPFGSLEWHLAEPEEYLETDLHRS